jgi:hypothetical protein
MTTNEFVELLIAILLASCALMLAVFSIECGGIIMRTIIFLAAMCIASFALIFIKKEQKKLRNKNASEAPTQ